MVSRLLSWITYQALTQDEWEQEECKQEHSLFMELLHQRLDPQAIVRDQAELGGKDINVYSYKNELQNAETFPTSDEEPEVTPESWD